MDPGLEVQETGDHHPDRFARGDLYLTLSRQGQVVGSTWLTTAGLWVAEARAFFVVNPGEVVIYDTYVDPAFRGQGFQNQISAFAVHVARRRGFRRVVTYVDSLNLPSLRVQRKMDRQRTQRVLCLRIGSAACCIGLNSPAATRFRK
ncbi:MAG: GNAT family N-acetyltransferase [Terriglobales bacterium]